MENKYLQIKGINVYYADSVFNGIASTCGVAKFCNEKSNEWLTSELDNYSEFSKEYRKEIAKRWKDAANLPDGKYDYYFNLEDKNKVFEKSVKELANTFGIKNDERIKSILYCIVRDIESVKNTLEANSLTVDKALAWLEKQGEQKSVEIMPIFRIGDVIRKKGKDFTFNVDRIQGGFYHCDHNNGAFFPIEEQDNWELIEQNPAWSEDDELRFKKAIYIFHQNGYFDVENWLKSLKDRVQPTWKPTEEQMEAFYWMKQYPAGEFAKKYILNSLYNDLKKL